MAFMHRALWQQLAFLWLSAIIVAALLLLIDLRQPYKFFWLIPYPNWRFVWTGVLELFRVRPLAATAILAIPMVALVGTIGLCLAKLTPFVHPVGSAG
jgi:hypothetical protein